MDLELTVNQALSLLASDHPPLLLDVREPWEFQTAHIQGSVIGQGFDKAQSISGGIDAWSTHIDPTIPRY
jgi:rhodanese-related sulfurtransferase